MEGGVVVGQDVLSALLDGGTEGVLLDATEFLHDVQIYRGLLLLLALGFYSVNVKTDSSSIRIVIAHSRVRLIAD